MFIPYYVLAIPYLIGVLLFLLWMFFNMWHLMRFGFFDFVGKLNGIVFTVFSIIIIALTVFMLQDVPWLDSFSPTFVVPSSLLPGSNL